MYSEWSADKNLFLFLNGKHHPVLDHFMSFSSNFFSCLAIYIILIYISYKFLKKTYNPYLELKIALLFVFLILETILCWGILPSVFPSIINRVAPCHDPEVSSFIHLIGDNCIDKYGFFAQRACLTFAISTFLFYAFADMQKWLKYLLILWALIVAYSRIYLGAQFPLNVLVSSALGLGIGYITYRLYYYINNSVLVI